MLARAKSRRPDLKTGIDAIILRYFVSSAGGAFKDVHSSLLVAIHPPILHPRCFLAHALTWVSEACWVDTYIYITIYI